MPAPRGGRRTDGHRTLDQRLGPVVAEVDDSNVGRVSVNAVLPPRPRASAVVDPASMHGLFTVWPAPTRLSRKSLMAGLTNSGYTEIELAPIPEAKSW